MSINKAPNEVYFNTINSWLNRGKKFYHHQRQFLYVLEESWHKNKEIKNTLTNIFPHDKWNI